MKGAHPQQLSSDWPQEVITWFRSNQRQLPWRSNPDPYWIWLSEMMLQQTQVRTVIPYFERFTRAYPTLESLARAEEADVLDLWTGLGYYSRARNLHRCARTVVQEYHGIFPQPVEELKRLPGIGKYSAGAIASIAFGLPVAVVDGNVKRVLARFLGNRQGFEEKELWRLLEEIVRLNEVAESISDFNQGLMELGALICTPRNPKCDRCPLASQCQGRHLGCPDTIPPPKVTRTPVSFCYLVAVIAGPAGHLMVRNSEGPVLKGFWEYPKVLISRSPSQSIPSLSDSSSVPAPDSPENEAVPYSSTNEAVPYCVKGTVPYCMDDPSKLFWEVLKLRIKKVAELPELRHQITFRKLVFRSFVAELEGHEEGDSLDLGYRWVTVGTRGFPVPAYVRKIAGLAATIRR